MEGWERVKCPDSFVRFYELDCMQLVEKLGNTPKKGKGTESMAQTEARLRRQQERQQEEGEAAVSGSGKSGTKTLPTANFNNKRNALYNFLGGRTDCITLRDWIETRYNDKKKFAAEHYVSYFQIEM